MPSPPHRWSYVFDEPTRILVVDDDPIQREFASVYLSAPMCAVDAVGDAGTAFDLLAREQYDIVLLDIEMPGMDGIEMVKRMRAIERLRAVPVVMATSHEDIISIDRAYAAGATSFTTKPINWRQFSYQIRNIIGSTRARNALPGANGGNQTIPAFAFHDEVAASLSAMVDAANRLAAKHGLQADPDLRTIVADAESSLQRLLPGSEPVRSSPVVDDTSQFEEHLRRAS